MPRIARLVIPGIPHHVTQRGNRRQPVFFSDADYQTYKTLLGEWSEKAGTKVWAWCLMPNHVHLVLVPAHADGLRAALGETHRRYTRHVNVREDWRGHLWQSRFASFALDEKWLQAAVRHVELNPVRAGLVKSPADWKWSSAKAHLDGKPDGLTDLAPMAERVPDWKSYLAGGLDDEALAGIRRGERSGMAAGSDAFLDSIRETTGRDIRTRPRGRPRVV